MPETTDNQLLPVQQTVQDVLQLMASNLPLMREGNAIGTVALQKLHNITITSDDQRTQVINQLAGLRAVYEKVNALRTQITTPFDQAKDMLMQFERALDPKGKDNDFAKAMALITAYDQRKIDDKAKAELIAENTRKLEFYKEELRGAVARQLVDMVSGQKKTFIDTMSKWEAGFTLENYDVRSSKFMEYKSPNLKPESYEACFNINFNRNPILNDADTKAFIESLKNEYLYPTYNEDYLRTTAQIINEYRAKMPDIKVQLDKIASDADAMKKRKEELEKEAANKRLEVDSQAKGDREAIDNREDLGKMQADFVEQATTQDLEAGPSKKVASFENDNLWLQPLLEVIGVVASSGKMDKIRNAKNEYIAPIDWWLKKYAPLGKPVKGVVLKDAAKTILRAKE